MKSLALALSFTTFFNHAFSQKNLSQKAIDDFSRAAQYTYLVDDNFYLTVNYYFQSIGKKKEDAHSALIHISTDPASRGLIFNSIHHNLKNNKLALQVYLANTMGIKTGTAPELAEYIYSNYSEINKLFTGTKTFHDLEHYWKYVVTIKGGKIILKSYPGKENDQYADKTKVQKTYVGTIVPGKITIPDNKTKFKFENGILYEMNAEGDWNRYEE